MHYISKFVVLTGLFIASLLLVANAASAAEVKISNAWLKESIPGTENGAGYLTLTNVGSNAVTLVGATTDAARATEVHQHIHQDGMMRMKRIPELIVEPNQTIVFQPGGYHLMLFGVKNAFRVGESIEFVLLFSDGDRVPFAAEVQPLR